MKNFKTTDRKLKSQLQKTDSLVQQVNQEQNYSIWQTNSDGCIEKENEMEQTFKLTQKDILEQSSLQTASNCNDFVLEHGPYKMDYSLNGRFLALSGLKGHLSLINRQTLQLSTELFIQETVKDIKMLSNNNFFAAAQQKYVYIYDSQGIEVHRLKSHIEPLRLGYLPFHFLLTSVGRAGWLKYQDVSTGKLVAEWRSGLGPCDVMDCGPNGIVYLGHAGGCVTLWTPTTSKPVVKMLTHKGKINALKVSGNHLATAGLDGSLRLWDLRNYKEFDSYTWRQPITCCDFSQKNFLAVGHGAHVTVYKDILSSHQNQPYMHHLIPTARVSDIGFCPFEDVLGISHSNGFTSIVVPGVGEANYDSLEFNPFETKSMRREKEVKMLLDKLDPEMIHVENVIGVQESKLDQATTPATNNVTTPKFKKRKRNQATRKALMKFKNVHDLKKEKILRRKEMEKKRTVKVAISDNPLARFK